MTTVRDLRIKAIQRLEAVGFDSPQMDVDLLLEQGLGLSTLDFILEPGHQVADPDAAAFQALIDRRLTREPVSQIVGRRDFWSLTFRVSRDCLTPRPDSETLIEAALKAVPDATAPLKILDLGTGSGCLLLSLMSELPNSRGVGIDMSAAALTCAKDNARRLGFLDRCDFRVSDWVDFAADQSQNRAEKFDIILCNPPYIAEAEKAGLAPDVRDYEPHMALFADDDGYQDYQTLSGIIPELSTPGGHIFMEIGHTQAARVTKIFTKTGAKNIRIFQDLAGRDRCVAFKY
ncbi:MAG: protein-(glutamine-N5) methyltransferase, release factor-specific [Alphaproteobacteria bacterium]|nr:MAG: protein-(glutamine-N5) methyltransferase, release factor-specific [Alphaproteobacteria bacterium]